ncbi:MAG: trigger factor [Trueperaceae bacterium]|nr:trigger factor [Trueperaceae bacterium]
MEAKVVEKQGANVTLSVRVDAATVDATFERVLAQLSRTVKVPGFRPGKAPRGVLEKRVGAEALAEEVRDALVEETYPQAVRELELYPIDAHFHADGAVRGQDFEFTVHADVYPDITLPDLETVKLEAEPKVVSDDDVRAALEQLRRENATLVPVERPVEATDWVLVARLDEGDEADESSTFQVHMDRAGEELKGQLVGKSMGDVLTATFTDPAPEGEDGGTSTTQIRLKVLDVKGKELTASDDDLALQLGLADGAELTRRVRESLETDARRATLEARRDEVVEKLVSGSTLELPGSLVRRRQRSLLQDLAHDLGHQGTTLERYVDRLEQRGKRDEFEAELKEAAEKGVRRDLVLERLMEVRGTEVSDAEYRSALKRLADSRGQDVGRMRQELGEEYLANYRFFLKRDKALREFINELAGEPNEALDETDADEAAEAAALSEDEAADHDHDHGHDHHRDHDHHHR